MSPRRRHYVRLFSNIYNVDLAIRLLNLGYTPGFVAEKLHCDRSSVISFQERKEKEGVYFKKFRHRRGTEKVPKKGEPPLIIIPMKKKDVEKINPGKDGYSDYLKQYNAEIKALQDERMDHARRVIQELREKKREEGYVEDPYVGVWGGPI